MQRGDGATAERLIREAIATKPDVRLARFNLALLAEQRGRSETAEREYYEELKAHPESYKAAFNMSRLYEQVGDREGQIGALKQSIESNPRFGEGHIFLAKAYLDAGRNFDEAIDAANKGLEYAPNRDCPARPLRAGRHLQPPGTAAGSARRRSAASAGQLRDAQSKKSGR